MLLAIVFAQLSRVYPQAGGPYVYPRVAFGELLRFLMAWGYWMSVWVGNAAIAIGTVAYLVRARARDQDDRRRAAAHRGRADLDADVRQLARREAGGRRSSSSRRC